MRTCISALVSAALVLMVTGCGGGGGASAPSAQMAQAALNSSYTYDILVTPSRGDDSTAGRLTLTISPVGTVLSKRGRVELTSGSRSFLSSIETYFTQDSSGSILYAGERNLSNGQASLCSTRPVAVRSPLKEGDTWSSSVTMDGGVVETWRSVVGAREVVSASGRTFDAFPISTTRTSNTGSFAYTAWYSPEYAAPVKATGRMENVEVTIVLSSVGEDSSGLDNPPPPPGVGGSGSGVDIDAPPPAPMEWEQEGQDVAVIIGEMLN